MGELPYKIPEKLKKVKVGNVDNTETVVPRTYSQEEIDSILQKREQSAQSGGSGSGSGSGSSGSGDDGGEVSIGINANLLKQLQNTVGVFNALKEFASNP
jgi:hypothetical protein